MAETHGITPEEVAREAAQAVVFVVDRQTQDPPGWAAHLVGLSEESRGRLLYGNSRDRHAVEQFVGRYHDRLAALFLAAIERVLREVPVPGALSAERVAEIEQYANGEEESSIHNLLLIDRVGDRLRAKVYQLIADRNALLDGYDHLARALHDCGQDGTAKVWAAGYDAGRESMKRAVMALIQKMCAEWGATLAGLKEHGEYVEAAGLIFDRVNKDSGGSER